MPQRPMLWSWDEGHRSLKCFNGLYLIICIWNWLLSSYKVVVPNILFTAWCVPNILFTAWCIHSIDLIKQYNREVQVHLSPICQTTGRYWKLFVFSVIPYRFQSLAGLIKESLVSACTKVDSIISFLCEVGSYLKDRQDRWLNYHRDSFANCFIFVDDA